MDCTERDLPETAEHRYRNLTVHLVVQWGSWGGWIHRSPLQSAQHATTAYLTQSWSASLPGLACPKYSQDNFHFFSRPNFVSHALFCTTYKSNIKFDVCFDSKQVVCFISTKDGNSFLAFAIRLKFSEDS